MSYWPDSTTPWNGWQLAQRALVVVSVLTLVVLACLLLWQAKHVFLLLFAAILLAVLLDGLTACLHRFSPLSRGWALALVVLALTGLCAGGMWLLAPRVVEQITELWQNLSASLEQLRAMLARSAWGQKLLNQLPNQLNSPARNWWGQATGMFSATLNGFINLVVVLFVSIYLAANPGLYTGGFVRLLPQGQRQRGARVLSVLGHVLRRWLAGRFLLMGVNGVLTALGLLLLGLPLPWTLGILAGLLNFIPNLGPVIAAVPALLIALAQSPQQALYVFLLYLFLQSLDGYVFTPLVQRRTVALPPALTITAQVLLGVLLGSLGVLLATPLAASALVLVKLLYLRDTLHEEVTLPGTPEAETQPA